jgi:site-specific recombinase XerD
VTRLRKMMLEELQRRNYSEHTTRYYIRTVEDFARRFNRPPDRLGPRHIREYQAELFQKRKLSSGTVTIRLAALRFFYIKTLKKTWSIAETPYPKRALHLPSILSQEEVTQLINAALTPYHHILLLTLYATGVRNAELTHLKVRDIDSKRMVIHIQGGKGGAEIAMSCSAPSCSWNCANIGVVCRENPAHGCFQATVGTTVISPSIRKRRGTPVRRLPSAQASRNKSIPTRCATASPRIFSRPARICALFRSC